MKRSTVTNRSRNRKTQTWRKTAKKLLDIQIRKIRSELKERGTDQVLETTTEPIESTDDPWQDPVVLDWIKEIEEEKKLKKNISNIETVSEIDAMKAHSAIHSLASNVFRDNGDSCNIFYSTNQCRSLCMGSFIFMQTESRKEKSLGSSS